MDNQDPATIGFDDETLLMNMNQESPTNDPESYHNNPISVLVDSLKKHTIENRVKTIQSLPTFCAALGPKRTRSELIPFIKDIMEDEEEVVISLVDTLPFLLECLGGKEHTPLLFESLESLLAVDSEEITEKVKKLITQIYNANPEVMRPIYLDNISKLWDVDKESKLISLYMTKFFSENPQEDFLEIALNVLLKTFLKDEIAVQTEVISSFSKIQFLPLIQESNLLDKIMKKFTTLKSSKQLLSNLNNLIVIVLENGPQELIVDAEALVDKMGKFLETKSNKAICIIQSQHIMDKEKCEKALEEGFLKDFFQQQKKDEITSDFIEMYEAFILPKRLMEPKDENPETLFGGPIKSKFYNSIESISSRHIEYQVILVRQYWKLLKLVIDSSKNIESEVQINDGNEDSEPEEDQKSEDSINEIQIQKTIDNVIDFLVKIQSSLFDDMHKEWDEMKDFSESTVQFIDDAITIGLELQKSGNQKLQNLDFNGLVKSGLQMCKKMTDYRKRTNIINKAKEQYLIPKNILRYEFLEFIESSCFDKVEFLRKMSIDHLFEILKKGDISEKMKIKEKIRKVKLEMLASRKHKIRRTVFHILETDSKLSLKDKISEYISFLSDPNVNIRIITCESLKSLVDEVETSSLQIQSGIINTKNIQKFEEQEEQAENLLKKPVMTSLQHRLRIEKEQDVIKLLKTLIDLYYIDNN